MSEEQQIADAIRLVLKAGYQVIWPTPLTGKAKNGIYIHETDLIAGENK